MSRANAMEISGKELLLRQWARRELGSCSHEDRVARICRTLFDLTRSWHGLGSAERKLLGLAAVVHDIGRGEGGKGHAQRGAEMILQNESAGLSETERRRLAYLTRYHRGAVPEGRDQEILDAKRGDDLARMAMLLGILRAADALDSREWGTPRWVFTLRAQVITICAYVEGDVEEAQRVFARPKKLRLMEETLDCEIRTQWFDTEALALVA